MRVHVLQHVPFEGLGSIEPWLQSRGAVITTTRFFATPELPEPDTIDALVVLGGPMSVNDEAALPWLRDEKEFVGKAIQSGKPVLGVCLGAQLMAASLGARVYANPCKEIGWFPVHAVAGSNPESFRFPETNEVFHWHGETFDLPPGAVWLARSEGCRHQAFQIGRRAIGLQFHLETTPESADAILTHCRHELVPDRFVQSEEELRSAPANCYQGLNQQMEDVLQYLFCPTTEQPPGRL